MSAGTFSQESERGKGEIHPLAKKYALQLVNDEAFLPWLTEKINTHAGQNPLPGETAATENQEQVGTSDEKAANDPQTYWFARMVVKLALELPDSVRDEMFQQGVPVVETLHYVVSAYFEVAKQHLNSQKPANS